MVCRLPIMRPVRRMDGAHQDKPTRVPSPVCGLCECVCVSVCVLRKAKGKRVCARMRVLTGNEDACVRLCGAHGGAPGGRRGVPRGRPVHSRLGQLENEVDHGDHTWVDYIEPI